MGAAAAALPALTGAQSLLGGASQVGGLINQARGERSKASGEQRSRTVFDPQTLAGIRAQQQRVQDATQGLASFGQQLQQQALSGAPQLGTISQPVFGSGLDQISQGLLARERQDISSANAARRQAIANQFRQNPGVARALQAQAANRAVLSQNPLQFQALAAQRQREGQEAATRLATEQASNQALLQQQAANQAARGEAFGFGQAGLAAQSGLLGQLGNLGRLTGETVTQSSQQQRKGGLFK